METVNIPRLHVLVNEFLYEGRIMTPEEVGSREPVVFGKMFTIVEALVTEHTRAAKKLSVTGAGHKFCKGKITNHQRELAQLTINTGNAKMLFNHKNYNFLDCDWFKKLLFSTNSLVKLLSDSLLSDSLLSAVCYRTVQ